MARAAAVTAACARSEYCRLLCRVDYVDLWHYCRCHVVDMLLVVLCRLLLL